ncbi:hypothetical protein D3C76_1554560 [compost metagenome]
MTYDILGGGHNREINAMIDRFEIQRCRPGVIEQNQRAMGVCGLGDCWDVLNLEGM